jgi:hypothetical protein
MLEAIKHNKIRSYVDLGVGMSLLSLLGCVVVSDIRFQIR